LAQRLKRWLLLLALAACALLLVLGEPAHAPNAAAAAAAPARTHVRFWHMWTAEWKVVVDRIVERFNRSQSEYWVDALSLPPNGA
jgi:hypothetical protein